MDTVFLIVSKAVWLLVRPETLMILLFAVPLVCLWCGRTKAAIQTLSLALGLTVVIGIFPLGNLILNPLERAYPANPPIKDPAGILVLGGAESVAPAHANSMAQVNDAGDRLIVAMHLARRFPGVVVLYTGGKVALTPVEEGSFEVGPAILRQLGLPEGRLIVEGRSRTTAENAALSRGMAPEGHGPWILVTSASHMSRALGSFCAAGWGNLLPYPTDYRGGAIWGKIGWNLAGNLGDLNIAVKEWIGLLAYWITGRTVAFFPTDCT